MEKIRLLQISDIHLPEAEQIGILDRQDARFPSALSDLITLKPLQTVIRRVQRFLQQGVDAVLFCGDLTTRGDLTGYKKCVQLLSGILKPFFNVNWGTDNIHIVAGNHDVNRDLCDRTGNDIFRKFTPLVNEWSAADLPILSSASRNTQLFTRSGSLVSIFSMNSCIGCGEKRSWPPEICDELQALFDDYSRRVGPGPAFDLLGEDIDTPAFIAGHIEEVADSISDLGPKAMPIIVGHHNILPQTVPRVSLYTELINSGQLRSRMVNCNRPVIYCHGHVHDDPIEVIQKPGNVNSQMLSISAPEIVAGFNLIDIIFGKLGLPIGCEVVQFRLQKDGSFNTDVRRVPLQPISSFKHVIDSRVLEIIKLIPSSPSRFKDVFADARKFRISKSALSEILLECEWFGILHIEDTNFPYDYWQIERVIP